MWIKRDNVAIFIAFLMVLPILWGNVSRGIAECDRDLLEMAHVFRFSKKDMLRKVYLPSVRPYFFAGLLDRTRALMEGGSCGGGAESAPARARQRAVLLKNISRDPDALRGDARRHSFERCARIYSAPYLKKDCGVGEMIKLQSISKSFDGVSVLENISAEIPDSGHFCHMRRVGQRKDYAHAYNSRARTARFRQYLRA